MPTSTADPDGTGPAGLLLLFAPGTRPDAAALAAVVEAPPPDHLAHVSHRPDPDAGWLEVLVSGLTFDVTGLAPALPVAAPAPRHAYGIDGLPEEGEAVCIAPSVHLAGGAGLAPVVRTLVGLGANLALRLKPVAAVWLPAGTLMESGYFARIVLNWLAGGAFPALGLTALVAGADGGMATSGLAHFIGQELMVEAVPQGPADTAKLAMRVADMLVREGPLRTPLTLDAPEGALLIEPSANGRRVLVWRDTQVA